MIEACEEVAVDPLRPAEPETEAILHAIARARESHQRYLRVSRCPRCGRNHP